MRELTDPELYQALEYARDLDGAATGEIIERFHLDQTTLAQTLFEVFPIVIAEQDQDMAQLFMSLCFDVICVFQKAFGFLPLKMKWASTGWKSRPCFWMLNFNH